MPVLCLPRIAGIVESNANGADDALFLMRSDDVPADVAGRMYLCGSCSSVLDVAGHLAQENRLEIWDSVLASRQWAGRGQLRRTWISEPGNLFAAVRLLMPNRDWAGLLPVLVGWALCLGLEDLGVRVRLKWPNDILLGGRKVGGILIEERGDVLLAGIGLNLVSSPGDELLRADRAFPAGSLHGALPDLSLFGLWLRLVNFTRLRYSSALSDLTPLEFSQFIEPLLAFFGSKVYVSDNRSSVRGVYTGLSPDGGIVLRTEEGVQTFHSGSLTPEG